MYYDIREWFGNILVLILIIGGLWLFIWLCPRIGYHFEKSTCSVWVDNKMVYNGMCHFVRVDSLGELGVSKEVTIYKDVNKWYPSQHYLSDNVQIKEEIKE